MENYLETINYDINGIKKLILEGQKTSDFSIAPIYSLFRDACIILFETNQVFKEDGVIQSDLLHFNVIKEVRHKVKTNQGFKNKKIFNKLLEGHKSLFGSDIDNIGFYLDNNILASSTLFPSFVFADTPLFNIFDRNTFIDFTSVIGSLMRDTLNVINKPIELESKPLININMKEYDLKEIWDQRFFSKDLTYNVFLTRILLVQNELTTCIWLENHLDYKSSTLNLDKYILLRLVSIKLFETMRNLLDIKGRAELQKHWNDINLNKLDYLLVQYEGTIKDEMKILRNMLHYNSQDINFFGYLQKQIEKDNEYPDKLIKIIFNDYISKIREIISTSLNIQCYESMSDLELITRRINYLNKEVKQT
ncbi:hypothetical protein [Lysinibacillus irui]|uniref:hypothetical protein n=1 Tax=Lysinibacillus irui TaxID=2998077 RepID=UPI002AD45230|nr:hypothetical protein [Lysinibacillus irui]MEA0562453.1 hypothetical protein [Lysinibacillus irui]